MGLTDTDRRWNSSFSDQIFLFTKHPGNPCNSWAHAFHWLGPTQILVVPPLQAAPYTVYVETPPSIMPPSLFTRCFRQEHIHPVYFRYQVDFLLFLFNQSLTCTAALTDVKKGFQDNIQLLSWFHILDVCISFCADTFRKSMDPTVHCWISVNSTLGRSHIGSDMVGDLWAENPWSQSALYSKKELVIHLTRGDGLGWILWFCFGPKLKYQSWRRRDPVLKYGLLRFSIVREYLSSDWVVLLSHRGKENRSLFK